MSYFWRNNSMPVKICAILTLGAMAYLFFVDGESFFGWTVFFISLALTILLHTIDWQNKEVEMPRSPKKHLITLISTKGKTSEEVAREASQNFQKYQRVEAENKEQPKL